MTNWTPEQLAFIQRVGNTNDSIRLDAVAGSGKTTTLRQASFGIDSGLTCTLVAFNKNTADEAAKKFPAHIQCKTLNSIGNGVWTRAQGRKALDTRKMGALTTDWCKQNLQKEDADLLWGPIKTVVTALKSGGWVPPQWEGKTAIEARIYDQEVIETILAEADMDKFNPDLIAQAAHEIMLNSIAEAFRSRIDFDDQIYMSTYFASEEYWPRNDVVLVDEAQDLSNMQHDMIDRLGAGSRLIVVGDPHQAIYGWRGASCHSLDELEERFGLERMPLTVSFRCPEAIIELAQEIVPHIQASKQGGTIEDWDTREARPASYVNLHADIDEDGEKELSCAHRGNSEPAWYVEDFERGSVVLCRNNAPLIKLGFGMIRNGIPCYFTGKDLAAGLKKIVQELPESTDLRQSLRFWYEDELARLEAKQQYALIDRHIDRYDALDAILAGSEATDKSSLIRGIDNLFAREPSPQAIELSTIHKSKGKEWSTVYFLNQHLLPGRWIIEMAENGVPGSDDLLQQEHNLRYVAITRSLSKLIFFTLNKDDKVKSRKDTP